MSSKFLVRGLLLVAAAVFSLSRTQATHPVYFSKNNLETQNTLVNLLSEDIIIVDMPWEKAGNKNPFTGEALQSISGKAAHAVETEIKISCMERPTTKLLDFNPNTLYFKYQPNTENPNHYCKFFAWAEKDDRGNKKLHLSKMPENGGSADMTAYFSPAADGYVFSLDPMLGEFEIIMIGLQDNHFRLTVKPYEGSADELTCRISLSNGKLWMAQEQNETSNLVINPTNGNSSKANHERDYQASPETDYASFSALTGTPNPFNALLHVRLSLKNEGDLASIALFDAAGRLKKQVLQATALPKGDYFHTVDTDALPTGMYFLVAETNGERKVCTVVKKE